MRIRYFLFSNNRLVRGYRLYVIKNDRLYFLLQDDNKTLIESSYDIIKNRFLSDARTKELSEEEFVLLV